MPIRGIIFERVIYNAMFKFFDDHELLSPNQFIATCIAQAYLYIQGWEFHSHHLTPHVAGSNGPHMGFWCATWALLS